MPRFRNINDIINQVASEVGLQKVQDVFAAPDSAFPQLVTLSNAVGYELTGEQAWQNMNATHSFTTQAGDSGEYALPDDFAYMINQTGWEQQNNVPLFGPLSPQVWAYLLGRDLVSYTIYASFRIKDGKFNLFPQPPPEGLEISFQYASRNWVDDGTGGFQDFVDNPGNIPLFEPYLFERLLKVRFLEARGFDTSAAVEQYSKALSAWGGYDKAAAVLNIGAGGGTRAVPLLNGWCNVPDTNYGQ